MTDYLDKIDTMDSLVFPESTDFQYCSDCLSNVRYKDGEPVCQWCNPHFRMGCTEELNFDDTVYNRED